MDFFKWESLLPVKALFGDDLPAIEMAGFDMAADVYETADGVNVEMQLPGISPDAYDIKVENGMLVVSGQRDKQTEVEDKNYYRKEIQRGSFERRVTLPKVDLKTENLSPAVSDGVLKLFIPKA